MRIVFARTRYLYDSYTDFWRLVEISAFPICFVDEMDLSSDNIYITAPMNGEWKPVINHYLETADNINARLVLWNLERPGDGTVESYKNGNQSLIDEGYLSDVLVSDRYLASQTGFRYMPFGLHPDLGTPGNFEDKNWDVIHLMCPSFRRGKWFDGNWMPLSRVYGVSVASNAWGDERHHKLQRSRFMANVHQDNHLYIEPLRFTLAAAYGLRILSESSYDFYPYNECDGILVPMNDLRGVLDRYNRVDYDLGIKFREQMLERFPFRKCVEEGL